MILFFNAKTQRRKELKVKADWVFSSTIELPNMIVSLQSTRQFDDFLCVFAPLRFSPHVFFAPLCQNRYPCSMKRVFDLLSVLALLAYAGVVVYTSRGAADPIWTAVHERGVLRVATDPGFRPFAFDAGDGLQGYDVDIAKELARRLRLGVEWVPVGYDALYDALSTRRADLLAAALPLAPEQGWRARFSTPYLNAGQVAVVRRGSRIADQDDLDRATVGAALGSDADTLLRSLGRERRGLKVRSDYETSEAAIDDLAAGRLDAAIVDAVGGIAAVNSRPALRIAFALTFDPYVLAVPVEAYRLQAEVDAALEAMRVEGFFDRLNRRWFRPENIS